MFSKSSLDSSSQWWGYGGSFLAYTKFLASMALQLLQWNVRGILAHRQEFYQLLSVNTFNIICLQESFLKPNKEYCSPGYNSIRSDKHAPKGGLVTFIRSGLVYTENQRPANMECQSVTVNTTAGPIIVINVYVSPGTDTTFPLFADLFSSTNTIVLGDFNALNCLWGSHTNDARRILLKTAITTNNYVVLNNGQGTHQTNNGTMTCIDVSIVSRILATKCTWSVFNNLMGSDHAPIKITFNARSLLFQNGSLLWQTGYFFNIQQKIKLIILLQAKTTMLNILTIRVSTSSF